MKIFSKAFLKGACSVKNYHFANSLLSWSLQHQMQQCLFRYVVTVLHNSKPCIGCAECWVEEAFRLLLFMLFNGWKFSQLIRDEAMETFELTCQKQLEI